MSIGAQLIESINNKQLIKIRYGDAYRVVQPHAYGVDKNGSHKLRAFQVGEGPDASQYTGWRLFNIDLITEHEALTEQFNAQSNYNPEDTLIERFFARV